MVVSTAMVYDGDGGAMVVADAMLGKSKTIDGGGDAMISVATL